MKKTLLIVAALCGTLGIAALQLWRQDRNHESEEHGRDPMAPYDAFGMARNYPDFSGDPAAYASALVTLRQNMSRYAKTGTFGREWLLEGPTNIGGRINCIAINPLLSSTIFSGTAYGGIFKTTNGGVSWRPVFDSTANLSVGSIAIDPADTAVMYAGTGDPAVAFTCFLGNGIYKSVNSGESWTHLGLDSVGIVSAIAIHPSDHNILYAATMGVLMQRNFNRGLYKSTDGGASWNSVLSLGNETGCMDVVIDPVDPGTIYATGMRRIRTWQESIVYGTTTRIYKSTDGGQSWDTLTLGSPGQPLCRINITMLPSDHNTIFASVIDSTLDLEGIYKSTDGGSSWNPLPVTGMGNNPCAGFGWYFGQLRINPFNEQEIFFQAVDLWKSTNQGQSWQLGAPAWFIQDVHADKHDLQFIDAGNYILATDGGLFQTLDDGSSWNDIDDIPITQFYHVTVSPWEPGTYYGGAQDNGTSSGNASSINSWPRIMGGDGFKTCFSANNQDVLYCETQNGGIYYSTFGSFGSFSSATAGIDTADRRNWDTPYLISKYDGRVYAGTQYVYAANDPTNPFFNKISQDLTDGNIYGNAFHNISTLSQSDVDKDILYAGTSDGNVWRTLDGGSNWTNITSTLPNRYVTGITTSASNAGLVYVSHSGYKANDPFPHIHKSYDHGDHWIDVSGDLPSFAVNDVLAFSEDSNMLAVATDAGVFITANGGVNWMRLGSNMPVFPVFDIEYEEASGKIIAGTQARSMMSYPLHTSNTGILQAMSSGGFDLYPVPAATTLHVNTNGQQCTARIFNMKGQLMMNVNRMEEQAIDIGGLAPGIYLLSLDGEQKSSVKKFIKL